MSFSFTRDSHLHKMNIEYVDRETETEKERGRERETKKDRERERACRGPFSVYDPTSR